MLQRLILLLLCLLPALVAARSMYSDGQAGFDPLHPERHATWKGRETMNVEEARTLCSNICRYLGVHPNTVPFLLEIAAAESDFGYYVRQVKGPAQSVWQIEPATARDMHKRLPGRNPELYRKIVALRDPTLDEEENVVTNLNYGGAMCVGILFLKGIRFEQLGSLQARAVAWKKYYNTYLGKGTLEGYCQKVMRHLGERIPADQSFVDAFQEPFDQKLLRGGNVFQQRDNERYLVLPADFDTSAIGQYYRRLLQEKPHVFEEIPKVMLQSPNIKAVMNTLTMELMRQIQKDPARIREYRDMPEEILYPLAEVAMHENAVKAYPHLPEDLQQKAEYKKFYESQLFLQQLLPH